MTKRLSEILAEARQPVASVEEQIEQYLEYLSTLTEEEVEEEIESLDELSKHTLGRYIKGAGNDRSAAEFNKGYWYGQDSRDSEKEVGRNAANAKKRRKGISKAVDKMTGRAKVNASEEVKPINELSKKTLKSYVRKATTSSDRAWNNAEKEEDKGMSTNGEKYPEKQKRHMDAAGKHIAIWRKRESGLKTANSKLSKLPRRTRFSAEETETLDLGGYQPVAGAEKDFVSKHKVQKHADPAGNKEYVFKGGTKVAKYPKADKGGAGAAVGEERTRK